jgi:hypothetical protein
MTLRRRLLRHRIVTPCYGILLTQTAMDTPHTARLLKDSWTSAYQAIDD